MPPFFQEGHDPNVIQLRKPCHSEERSDRGNPFPKGITDRHAPSVLAITSETE